MGSEKRVMMGMGRGGLGQCGVERAVAGWSVVGRGKEGVAPGEGGVSVDEAVGGARRVGDDGEVGGGGVGVGTGAGLRRGEGLVAGGGDGGVER